MSTAPKSPKRPKRPGFRRGTSPTGTLKISGNDSPPECFQRRFHPDERRKTPFSGGAKLWRIAGKGIFIKSVRRPLLRRLRGVYHRQGFNRRQMRQSSQGAGKNPGRKLLFRLSRYSEEIGRRIESGEMKIIPRTRANEILSLIERGLEDVSFSRPAKDLPWECPCRTTEARRCMSGATRWRIIFPFWITPRNRKSSKILAGRCPLHRKRHSAFPRRHLARDAAFGRIAVAEGDFRPRVYRRRGAENVQIARQCR